MVKNSRLFVLFACSVVVILLLQGTQSHEDGTHESVEGIHSEEGTHESEEGTESEEGAYGDETKEFCSRQKTEGCMFSVNPQGHYCVLGVDHKTADGFKCMDSGLTAEDPQPYYQDPDCLDACGVDRHMIGLPTPDSMDKQSFLRKFCTKECTESRCQNVRDVHKIIAKKHGVDVDLDDLCKKGLERQAKAKGEHRSMAEVESKSPSSAPAPGGAKPVSEMASSLWQAATGLFESAKSPAASKAVDSANKAVASSPSTGDAIESAFNAAAPSPSTGASGPSGGNAAGGDEDDYSA